MLGELVHEDGTPVAGTKKENAADLQELIKERDQLRQRLLEVEALIQNGPKD